MDAHHIRRAHVLHSVGVDGADASRSHDVLLVDKFEYRFHTPHEGDIVVFPPPIPTPDDFIKRVIGLPGDTLRDQQRRRVHQREGA